MLSNAQYNRHLKGCSLLCPTGPGAYDGGGGPGGPSWTLGQRIAPASAPGADGPPVGHYDVPLSLLAGPAFTMAGRPGEALAEVGGVDTGA